MQTWGDDFVDLVYLDPPFNSKANYNILFGKEKDNKAQLTAFSDLWYWDDLATKRVEEIGNAVGHPAHRSIKGLHVALGDCGMMSYLSYMAERLVEIRRVLNNTGSIYLHCDSTMSHYLKIVMDDIFAQKNFRNEIVWRYGKMQNASKNYPRNNDYILFYTKTNTYTFNMLKGADSEYKERWKKYIKNNKIFYGDVKHKEDKMLMGRIKKIGKTEPLNDNTVLYDFDKEYKVLDNNWYISILKGNDKERTGYPTQKPLALLKRIIKASSNEGDLVLDPFCGCGTTIAAADRWDRKWLGIDISALAIDLVQGERFPHRKLRISGIPEDFKTAEIMVRNNPFDFEKWAITRIPGMLPNNKQRGDGGVDGRGMLYNWRTHKKDLKGTNGLVLSQVKGGSFHLGDLRDFLHTVEREKASFGVFITLSKVNSNNAKAEMQTAGDINIGVNTYKRVQLWSIEEYFDEKAKLPKLPPLADPVKGTVMNQSLFR